MGWCICKAHITSGGSSYGMGGLNVAKKGGKCRCKDRFARSLLQLKSHKALECRTLPYLPDVYTTEACSPIITDQKKGDVGLRL